jgi:hypothetical protein
MLRTVSLASTLPLAAACLFVLSGCGARSAIESASTSSTSSACEAPAPSGTPAQCSTWQPAGPVTRVSEPEPASAMIDFESVVPTAGGALLAWASLDDAPTSTWRTRAIDFDGEPRSGIDTHLSFPTADGASGMLLAGQACAFVGLAGAPSDGCRIVPLDENGASAGPAAGIEGAGVACSKLGPAPDGYSFVTIASDFAGADLVTVSAAGSVLATTSLPSPAFAYGYRIVLSDGSFLISTYEAPDGTANESRVQHFSAGGAPIAAAAVIASPASFPVQMAETGAGALGAWTVDGSSLLVRPLDGDGHPVAAAALLAATNPGTMHGVTLAGTPGGDVILAWSDLEAASALVDLHVIALGPDGAPRGAPTFLGSFVTLGWPELVVEAGGQRALLVFAGAGVETSYGVLAIPLACAP